MIAERVLQEVDGQWDWFGYKNNSLQPYMEYSYEIKDYGILVSYRNTETFESWTKVYSLADLFTNKSFLEALVILHRRKIGTDDGRDLDITPISIYLTSDLINNEGKNGWQICADFIGLKGDDKSE